jgi:Putative peptidoglycan binding domain
VQVEGQELRLSMIGDDVGHLQDDLRRLGASISFDEVDARALGLTTRKAIIAYQGARGLEATGVVDERTAAALSSEIEELDAAGLGLVVYGRIMMGDEAVTVQAFDRDLRSEERLGEVNIRDGTYEIAFTAEQFSRAEKGRADLVVRVANAAGLPVGESPILFNAPAVARVDVVIGEAVARLPSEYEALLAEITPLCQGLVPASLVEDETHQDVAFLAGETGLDAMRIAFFIASQKLADRTSIPAEVFYGLFREGLPTRLAILLQQRHDVLTRALVRAAERSIVPAAVGADAGAHVEMLKALVARLAIERPVDGREGAPGDVLALALPNDEMRQGFLDAYVRNRGSLEAFWAGLRDRPEYAEHIDDLQMTLHLAALTDNHLPLMRELARMRKDEEVTRVADLARFDEEAWTRILTRDGGGESIGVPAGVPGESDELKARTYARALANRVEEAFPRQYVRHRLEEDEDLPGRDNLRAFLDANPDFDLRTTRLDSYLAAHPAAMDTVPQPGPARLQIKAFQRIYRLAPRYAEATALIKAGITSAHAITRMGFNVFRDTIVSALQPEGV